MAVSTLATVDVQRTVKISGFAVDVDIQRVERGATRTERFAHDLGCRVEQLPQLSAGDFFGDARTVDAGPPHCGEAEPCFECACGACASAIAVAQYVSRDARGDLPNAERDCDDCVDEPVTARRSVLTEAEAAVWGLGMV